MSPQTSSRRPRPILRHFAGFGIAALLSGLILSGCDGSGSDGGGGGGPTGPQPFVNLISDSGDIPSVTLARSTATQGANLVLEIQANELENVRTIDFVLTYPDNLLRATTTETGDFLGLDASVITTALGPDRLQVLMTRTANTGVTGSGLILTLRFEGLAPGSGRIDFTNPEAATPTGLAIAGIDWLGGSVEVSP